MSIIGESQYTTIDGNKTQIFQIQNGVDVTIQNLTLTNGNTFSYNGGAIYNYGILTVTNCTFRNNNATDGGAIFNAGTLTVTNSIFTGNAGGAWGYYGDGGAIYNTGTSTITNCTFTNNTVCSTLGGGAIYNYGILNITCSTFTDNSANDFGGGGAIYNYGTSTITGTIFNNNSADYNGGGAIANINGSNLTVSNSTFLNNSVTHDGGAINNAGGAFLNVDTSNFLNNSAINSSGAIMNWQSAMTVTSSNFTGNTAGWQGNAIGNYYNNATINFNRIVGNGIGNGAYELFNGYNGIVDATDNWWGSNSNPTTLSGYIYNSAGKIFSNPWLVLTISNLGTVVTQGNYTSNITADLTRNNLGVNTSLIDNVPDGIPINFTTNQGTINTTVLTTDGVAVSTLTSTITAGMATVSAILDSQTVSMVQEVFNSIQAAINDTSTVNRSTILLNSGTYNGLNNMNLTISKNISIEGVNPSTTIINGQGQGIITAFTIANGATVDISNITFTNINSGITGYGGALLNQGNLTVTNCIFTNNIANWGGAIGNINGGNLTVFNSTFLNNTATHDGGAINSAAPGTVLTVMNCNFLNNTAAGTSGAIINWEGTMTVTGSNFSGNTGGWQGNAIGNYYGNATINFNRIVGNGNGNYELYNGYNGIVNATDNWWGSNSNPTTVSGDIYNSAGIVTSNPWLVLKVNSSCDRSNSSNSVYNYKITADLTHDNNGNDTSPKGSVPDDIPLYFNTTLGLIATPVSTQNGKAVTTLTNTSTGTANVSVTLDNQTINTQITIMGNNGTAIINTRTGQGFSSIQSAIDSSDTHNGDILTLTDGIYTENIIVDKQITIKPVSGANVTVQAVDTNSGVFTINNSGNGSTIQGLNIDSGLYGIYLNSANNCNINGNNISNNVYEIYLDNSNNNNITENTVTGSYYGIYLNSSNNNILNENNITNNSYGIYLINSTNTIITENNVTNSGVGIDYTNSNSTTIDGSNNVTNSSIQDILQIDTTGIVMSSTTSNCGPAALATLMQKFGINVTQDELAIFAGTDTTGTTMSGLIQAAQNEGLIAQGFKLSVDELVTGNIVFLTINGRGHWCIITSINDTTVYLEDSDFGNINMTLANFTADYLGNATTGYALVVTNDSNDPQLNGNEPLTNDEMQNIKGSISWDLYVHYDGEYAVWVPVWRWHWRWYIAYWKKIVLWRITPPNGYAW